MTHQHGVSAEALLERVEACDLSALLTLRMLAREDDPGVWVPGAALVGRLRAELERSGVGVAGRGGAEARIAAWEGASRVSQEEHDYFQQHVLSLLLRQGLVETRDDGGTEEGLVRLSAPLRGEREALLDRIVARLSAPAGSAGETGSSLPRVPGGSTLAATGLVKVYRKRKVVNDVDLHVSQGEIVGLLGPNGAGKTTTFYMMVGLIAPDAGRVTIAGEDVTETPMFRRARRGLGYLAQEPSIFRKLTVEENVLAILQMLKLSRPEQERRLEDLLDELGIKHLRHSRAYALSGGERRRLEITRALVGQPKFMLLDEPFAGVDPIAVHDIQQIVADLRRRNIGVLISDHNVEQTLDIVDRAYIMYEGRVRVSGTVSELVWNDEVAEIYLGPTLTARMRQRYANPE